MSSWPPGRRSPAPSATPCRSPPVAGVRGDDLAADNPLRREWDLIVVGPRFAAALVAHDLGDDGPDDQRRYDVVVTHDRELVIRAAEPLLRRLVPEH